MSLRRWLPLSTVLLVSSLFLPACGGDPPDKEIQQAEAAIAAAVAAGAEQYAADELKAAREAVTHAREAVQDRDYRLALNHALDGRESAQSAAAQASSARAAARDAASKAISAGAAAIESASSKIKAADAAHVSPRILSAPRASVAAAQAHLQEARTAWDKGDFPAATMAATAASEGLAAVADDLDSLVPATRRRR